MFHNTRLVQRLDKPVVSKFGPNPFAFGGGLKNGGLNPEAMSLLNEIFEFDYMGAAEYEFGALPQALKVMAESEMVFGSLELKEEDVALQRSWKKRIPLPLHYTTIYFVCRKSQIPEVEARIREDAKDKLDIKCGEGQFSRTLRADTKSEFPDRTIGWLELDNGFFYFVDEEAAKKTATLFGIDL